MEVGAIVLAGGVGSRMRPLTDACPKPLLPLGAEPLVGYQLRRLARVGVHRVVLATGYLAAQFDELLGDGSGWGLRLTYSVEEEPLGTGGALRAAVDHLPGVDRIVVLNGDLLSSHDLAAQLRASERAGVTVHVRTVPDVAPYGQVTCDIANGRVRAFAEKSGSGRGLANAGTYVVSGTVARSLPAGRSSWERDLLPALIEDGADVIAWEGDGYFRDVGRPTSYRIATVDAVTGTLPDTRGYDGRRYVATGALVSPNASLTGGSSVQGGAVVGSGAQLRGTVVLAGAQVGEDARLTDCIVLAGARVPAGADARETILGAEPTFE